MFPRPEPTVLLVSASPRRRDLLRLICARFRAHDAGIDESRQPGEKPDAYVGRLAREKALAGLRLLPEWRGPALGADTVVVLGERILGKPRHTEEAREMLESLSGTDHWVLTAVALAQPDGSLSQRLSRTRVRFAKIPPQWIAAYAAGDEAMDKAGAYAIQGLAGQWVETIEGSYSGVMGLPLGETAELLKLAGVPLAPMDAGGNA